MSTKSRAPLTLHYDPDLRQWVADAHGICTQGESPQVALERWARTLVGQHLVDVRGEQDHGASYVPGVADPALVADLRAWLASLPPEERRRYGLEDGAA